MRLGSIRFILVVSILPLLAAAGAIEPIDRDLELIADPEHAAMVQSELTHGNPGLDLARVVVVRLTIGSRAAEVTSVVPAILAVAPQAGIPAYSVSRYDLATDELTFFTREPATGRGYRMVLPRAALVEGARFEFPLLEADGSVVSRTLTLQRIIEQ